MDQWYAFLIAVTLPRHLNRTEVAMVRLLLEVGAEKNARTFDGKTALHCATQNGYLEVVRLLVSFGADKDLPDANGETALFAASQRGQVQLVYFLLESGSDPNRCNCCGATPLIVASLAGHVQVIRLLLDAGVDVDFRARAVKFSRAVQKRPRHDSKPNR